MPTLCVNDTELYYEVHGQGRPFLFLSETHCDGEVWKIHQVSEFSRDHRGIIMGLPRHRPVRKPSIPLTRRCSPMTRWRCWIIWRRPRRLSAVTPWGAGWAQIMALDHPARIKALILASTGASYPDTKGIPLKIATEMVEWGYEKYVRDHSILVGFTDEFAASHPDRVENYLRVRMANMGPVEFYFRHLLARQGHGHQRPPRRNSRSHPDTGG